MVSSTKHSTGRWKRQRVGCKRMKTQMIQIRHVDGYFDFQLLVLLPGKWHYCKLTNTCSQSLHGSRCITVLPCFALPRPNWAALAPEHKLMLQERVSRQPPALLRSHPICLQLGLQARLRELWPLPRISWQAEACAIFLSFAVIAAQGI